MAISVGGRLERQWSHPNLRPRPHPSSAAGAGRDGGGGSISACGRRYVKNHTVYSHGTRYIIQNFICRLPKTPQQPPGTIIVIENMVPAATATAPVKPGIKKEGGQRQLPARPQAPPLLERSGSSAAIERVVGGMSALLFIFKVTQHISIS